MSKNLLYRGTEHVLESPTLSMQNVSVAYSALGKATRSRSIDEGVSNALENVTFTGLPGEQIGIIGPNGAGKSTLLKVAAGILNPSKGEVQLFGSSPDDHICIAYVPQRSEIDWSFPVTVADVVMMGRTKQIGLFRRPSRRDHDRVHNALERVDALNLAKKQIGELSGGQQQRVFIARALAMEANLLLMDEPLTGLDLPSQAAIFKILESLRRDKVTVLLATHDLGLAAERFDRIMLLHKSIVALGPASDVLTPEYLLAAYGRGVPNTTPHPFIQSTLEVRE